MNSYVRSKLSLSYEQNEMEYSATYYCMDDDTFYWYLDEYVTGTIFERIKSENKIVIDEFRRNNGSGRKPKK